MKKIIHTILSVMTVCTLVICNFINVEAYSKGTYKLNCDMTVRKSASKSSKAVGYLKKGRVIKVKSVKNKKWGQITYNSKTAYVSLKYSTKVSTTVNVSNINTLTAAKTSDNIIIVSTSSKTSTSCTFKYYKKTSGKWKEVYSCNGYVGEKGIGKAKEGVARTPVGIYHFTYLMGIKAKPGDTKMSYHQIDKNDYWCGGKYYNKFIDEDHHSHKGCSKKNDERLYYCGTAYHYLAAFDYNKNCVKGAGSAFFLHCTFGMTYTGGCVAIAKSIMKKMITSIDKNTVMIIDTKSNIINY